MKVSVEAVFAIGYGLFLIIFRSWFSRSTEEWNCNLLGIKSSEQWYRMWAIIFGILFIMLGILKLLQIVE